MISKRVYYTSLAIISLLIVDFMLSFSLLTSIYESFSTYFENILWILTTSLICMVITFCNIREGHYNFIKWGALGWGLSLLLQMVSVNLWMFLFSKVLLGISQGLILKSCLSLSDDKSTYRKFLYFLVIALIVALIPIGVSYLLHYVNWRFIVAIEVLGIGAFYLLSKSALGKEVLSINWAKLSLSLIMIFLVAFLYLNRSIYSYLWLVPLLLIFLYSFYKRKPSSSLKEILSVLNTISLFTILFVGALIAASLFLYIIAFYVVLHVPSKLVSGYLSMLTLPFLGAVVVGYFLVKIWKHRLLWMLSSFSCLLSCYFLTELSFFQPMNTLRVSAVLMGIGLGLFIGGDPLFAFKRLEAWLQQQVISVWVTCFLFGLLLGSIFFMDVFQTTFFTQIGEKLQGYQMSLSDQKELLGLFHSKEQAMAFLASLDVSQVKVILGFFQGSIVIAFQKACGFFLYVSLTLLIFVTFAFKKASSQIEKMQ